MWAFVGFARVVVAAAESDVMLIAHFELLQALHFVAVVVQGLVNSLTFEVAQNGLGTID